MYLLSAFGGGLFIIPVLTGLAAIFFLGKAIISSKSNSTTQLPGQGGTTNNTGNVPITKLGFFWFAVALAVATIIIIIVMVSEK